MKAPAPMNTKISVRLTEKQLKALRKQAKHNKMAVAEYRKVISE